MSFHSHSGRSNAQTRFHSSTPVPTIAEQAENATQQIHQADEYKKYLEIPAHKCDEPLSWWKERRTEWPSLTTMAVDLLSVPLMSAECERIFSAPGNLITRRRSHMKDDIIEATTGLRAWQGLF